MKNKQNLSFGFPELLFCAICAVFIMAAQAVLCIYTTLPHIITTLFMVAVYIASLCTFALVRRSSAAKNSAAPLSETVSVLAEAIVNLPDPCLICPIDSDTVIWYNKAAADLFGRKKVSFSDLFQTLPDFEGGVRLGVGEKRFTPTTFTGAGRDGKQYRVFIMNDVTEADKDTMELLGRECAVAYITVDNLGELLNYEQEDYRSASGETEALLRRWAQDAGGILKEYQQDKFVFLFERSLLAQFVANGFDILDKIRNIRVGSSSIPVTISAGVSDSGSTLSQREKAAQSALETALQRGGDQVIVKYDNGVEIFGGKTKMQQKRTTVRARVVATELISHISASSNVLIMGHKYADFDAFGSCVGLARLCHFCGVPVNIVSDMDDTAMDSCRAWLANEEEYKTVFVDADTAMDKICSDTLLIISDVNNRSQFESPTIADHCQNLVIIDHHRKTADFERTPLISYIEPAASAASELVSEMLEQVLPAGELLSKEADLLMAGILLDTNQFTKNTGTRTFSAALYLRSAGADVGEVQEFFKTDLDDFQRELKFHSNVEIYRDVAAISIAQGECTVKDKIPAAKAANKLLTVKDVKASFALVPIGDEVHISARSTGTINVQLILERLRGGGHFDAAGARLAGVDIKQAVAMLKEAIDAHIKEKTTKGEK